MTDMFVGAVVAGVMPTAPKGWLLCNGQAVSREEYSKLFEIIGTTYGNGDGNTTFNIPNYSKKFLEMDSTQELGTDISAGLPTIDIAGETSEDGSHAHTRGSMNIKGSFTNESNATASGAFTKTSNSRLSGRSGNDNYNDTFNFDASRNWTGSTSSSGTHKHTVSITSSSTIYGASETVQPAAIIINYFIKCQ